MQNRTQTACWLAGWVVNNLWLRSDFSADLVSRISIVALISPRVDVIIKAGVHKRWSTRLPQSVCGWPTGLHCGGGVPVKLCEQPLPYTMQLFR